MPNNVSVAELKAKAKELRLNIVQTTFNATSGHVGGSMSSADMLIALYFKYLNCSTYHISPQVHLVCLPLEVRLYAAHLFHLSIAFLTLQTAHCH